MLSKSSKIIVPPVTLTSRNSTINIPVPSNFYNKFPIECQKIVVLFGLYSVIQFPGNNDNFDDFCQWYVTLENLAEHLDKSSAIELVEFLPVLANAKKMFLTDEQYDITCHFYAGLKEWLRHWEDNLDTSELQKSEYAIYEGAAVEAKRRYELMSALFSRNLVDKVFFPNTNLSWLLAQTSIFWGSTLR